jgi:hypothetical protein
MGKQIPKTLAARPALSPANSVRRSPRAKVASRRPLRTRFAVCSQARSPVPSWLAPWCHRLQPCGVAPSAHRTSSTRAPAVIPQASKVLRRIGWQATVLERAPELAEIGAGMSQPPNVLRGPAELGLEEQARR